MGFYQSRQFRNLLFQGDMQLLHFLFGNPPFSTQSFNQLIVGIRQDTDHQTEDAAEIRRVHESGW